MNDETINIRNSEDESSIQEDGKPEEKAKERAPEWLFERIDEASKNARKIYLIYVGLLAYCALTIVSTTDRQLVLNEPVNLPIINVGVSLNGFFILAPFLMIFVFVYFQLYLNKLKRLFNELTTEYATGKESRVYPWMINFVYESKLGFISKIQRFIVNFTLWWAMPLVLILNALWYVKKHSPFSSYVIGITPFFGLTVVILFWNLYESNQIHLKLKEQWRLLIKSKNKVVLILIILAVESLVIFIFIPYAFRGGVYVFLRPLLCVDLSYQKLVSEENEEYNTLYWVDLQYIHLEGANLTGAILKKADLKGAKLNMSNISNANLCEARLEKAEFQDANLWKAQLRGANLDGIQSQCADLQWARLDGASLLSALLKDANLREAQLDSANLLDAQLQGANINGAHLMGAKLIKAQLQGAKLRQAQLKGAYLREAQFSKADLNSAQLQGADLRCAKLDSVCLVDAQLQGAHLYRAQFQGADLSRAQLDSADFHEADLRGVKILSFKQFSNVRTLYNAVLDSVLKIQLMNSPRGKPRGIASASFHFADKKGLFDMNHTHPTRQSLGEFQIKRI